VPIARVDTNVVSRLQLGVLVPSKNTRSPDRRLALFFTLSSRFHFAGFPARRTSKLLKRTPQLTSVRGPLARAKQMRSASLAK
jgi:hypothetical protein